MTFEPTIHRVGTSGRKPKSNPFTPSEEPTPSETPAPQKTASVKKYGSLKVHRDEDNRRYLLIENQRFYLEKCMVAQYYGDTFYFVYKSKKEKTKSFSASKYKTIQKAYEACVEYARKKQKGDQMLNTGSPRIRRVRTTDPIVNHLGLVGETVTHEDGTRTVNINGTVYELPKWVYLNKNNFLLNRRGKVSRTKSVSFDPRDPITVDEALSVVRRESRELAAEIEAVGPAQRGRKKTIPKPVQRPLTVSGLAVGGTTQSVETPLSASLESLLDNSRSKAIVKASIVDAEAAIEVITSEMEKLRTQKAALREKIKIWKSLEKTM